MDLFIQKIKYLLVLGAISFLTACGGGSGSDSASGDTSAQQQIPSILNGWSSETDLSSIGATFTQQEISSASLNPSKRFIYYYDNGDYCSCYQDFSGTEQFGYSIRHTCDLYTSEAVSPNITHCSAQNTTGLYARTQDGKLTITHSSIEEATFKLTKIYSEQHLVPATQTSQGILSGWRGIDYPEHIHPTDNDRNLAMASLQGYTFKRYYYDENTSCSCKTFNFIGDNTSGSIVRNSCSGGDVGVCNLLNTTGTYAVENNILTVTYADGEDVRYSPEFVNER
jgi:hypothetical protein